MYTPLQWQKKDGKRTDYRYDFLARLVDTAYPDGSHERLFRDGAGNRIKHVLPEQYKEAEDDGEGWTYTYDEGNRLTSVNGPDGVVENTYAYDLWGNCVRKMDEKGCSTYYAYDLNGRLVRELAPVGEDTEGIRYRMTSYEYDDNGNKIREVRHGGSYGAEGELLEAGEDLELAFAYDAKNRLVRAEDGTGARVSFQYDARGNRIKEEQVIRSGEGLPENAGREQTAEKIQPRSVLRKIRYSYDRAGRLVKKSELLDDGLSEHTAKAPVAAVTSYAYDANGNRVSIITPEGYHISRSYDDRDRLITERVEDKADGTDCTTFIAYDQAGNITETTDAKGGKIRYAHNSQGKVCSITDQSGNTETFRYDKEGRQIQHTDRKGILTETKYNVYGQPVLQVCTDKKGNRHVMGTWEYDDLGQMKKSVAGGFCYTYLYPPDGKLLKKWSSGKPVISCDYYKSGELKSLTDVSGKTLYYTYDENGRLQKLKEEDGKGLTTYQYTAAGRLKEARTLEGFTASYEYDGDGNLSRLRIGNEEKGSLLYDAFLLYDLNGNRTGKRGKRLGADGNMRKMDTAYSYDRMNRLTEERREGSGERYSYDLAGNRIKKQHCCYALASGIKTAISRAED